MESDVLPDQMALREPAVRPSVGAGSDSETVEYRPADLTLGRRGPAEREEAGTISDSVVRNPQQQQQNEHQAFAAQASLGNNLPLAGC